MSEPHRNPEPSTLADDEAALQRGKSGPLIALAVIGVAFVAGAFVLLTGGDEARVYGALGRQINGMRQEHFDQFWGCAFPGANLKDIKSNAELATQLDGRASSSPAAYALHLRDKCAPKLAEIESKLDALIIPIELKPDVDALKDASGKLRGSVSAYVSYLDTPELKYDADSAKVYIAAISRAWYDFRREHAAINQLLKKKLSQ